MGKHSTDWGKWEGTGAVHMTKGSLFQSIPTVFRQPEGSQGGNEEENKEELLSWLPVFRKDRVQLVILIENNFPSTKCWSIPLHPQTSATASRLSLTGSSSPLLYFWSPSPGTTRKPLQVWVLGVELGLLCPGCQLEVTIQMRLCQHMFRLAGSTLSTGSVCTCPISTPESLHLPARGTPLSGYASGWWRVRWQWSLNE